MKISSSIVTKLWASILILVFLTLLLYTVLLSDRIEKIVIAHETNLMREHGRQWATIMQSGIPDQAIQQQMGFWGLISHYKISVIDQDQLVRFASDQEHSPLGKKEEWLTVTADLLKQETTYSVMSKEFNMDMTATLLPVTFQGQKLLIVIHAPNHELLEINKTAKSTMLILAGIFLLFSAVIALALSHWLAKPIIAIRQAAFSIAHGDFDIKLDLKRNDELGDLAATINTLAARLKRTIHNLYYTNKELSEVLKQWKEFLADVSHELRTPLFLISGSTEAILDGVVSQQTAKTEYLPLIQKESLRLQKIVEDLTRIEQRTTINKTDTCLIDLITDTVKPFNILLKERPLNLVISDALNELPPISLDPERFSEVIFNLVDNAIRYTPPGGSITITAQTNEADKLQLEITDTGVGIPSQHLPYLFDRFYRVDKARSRERGGSGLGLAIVKRIVDLHKGEISVTSKVNQGTVFTIIIPVS